MTRRLMLFASFAMVAATLAIKLAAPVQAANTETYLVVYSAQAVPADASAAISAAGGTLVANYSAIGVAVARSDRLTFRTTLLKDRRIQGVSATTQFATRLSDDGSTGAADAPVVNTPVPPGAEPLSGLQWDMAQIHVPEAHEITGGNALIVVGDIDSGLDYTHPDLAANVDFANSVSCVGGVPNQNPAAWKDDDGHGTHTAGTIAAAHNGIGIVGVAPNVRIAGIKTGDANGFFYPEAVVCAFVWVATHHIDVTNNSYFADPWLFNCRNDPDQRAIWTAERRAIRFAIQSGTTVVAAAGNFADDLAHPTADATSPDDTNPVLRQIHNDCAVIPVEVPGVIGVSANGNLGFKSFYSSYGVGSVQVIAPGGDSILQRTAAAVNGRVLSTYPPEQPCARRVVDASGATYCYLQGTSMASPHVAGVAALIASQRNTPPGGVGAGIQNTADPSACPADISIYAPFPSDNNGAPQVCRGGIGYNSFNGYGQVNALRAVQ